MPVSSGEQKDQGSGNCKVDPVFLQSEKEELHIGIVNYDIHSANGQEREAGFRERIAKDDRVKTVETINVLSTTEDAREKTKILLDRNPKINVIATFNEWTSL